MFIQTEHTPNPNALKFLPGQVVMLEGTAFFSTPEAAARCPLAAQLLGVEGITDVFLSTDFLSITKTPDVSWQTLRPLIFAHLVDHFLSDRPLFLTSSLGEESLGGSSLSDHSSGDQTQPSLSESRLAAEGSSREVPPRESDPALDAIVKEIKELLDTRIRPAVRQDGGDIVFDRFEGGVVYVHLQGACSGCPSAGATLKAGIENTLRYYIPEVEEVRAL